MSILRIGTTYTFVLKKLVHRQIYAVHWNTDNTIIAEQAAGSTIHQCPRSTCRRAAISLVPALGQSQPADQDNSSTFNYNLYKTRTYASQAFQDGGLLCHACITLLVYHLEGYGDRWAYVEIWYSLNLRVVHELQNK